MKLVPVLGTIGGGMINAAVATTTTKAMGELYTKYLDSNFDTIYNGEAESLSFDFKSLNFKFDFGKLKEDGFGLKSLVSKFDFGKFKK